MTDKNVNKSVVLFLSILCGSIFCLQKGITQPLDGSLAEKYRAAIEDAALVEPGEAVDTLIPIAPENPLLEPYWSENKTKILMVTWKSQNSYDKFIKPFKISPQDTTKLIWVTVTPQVKEFCQQYLQNNPQATKEDLELRLKQYLGLNPSWQYDVFVEMWVNPKDLFRPCVDPEITDTKCNLNFGDEIPKIAGSIQDSPIMDYKIFYKDLYYRSIRSVLQPFTGLGYTYDWGNQDSRVGASEFILIPGAAYTVKDSVPTLKYCQ
jgi:hypothetical protein